MTMQEQLTGLTAIIIAIGTAIGSGIAAARQRQDAKEARKGRDETIQTMIDLGVEVRDLKKELETTKAHTEVCERDRKELGEKVGEMRGSLATMERLVTMQDKVPMPFVEFITKIAQENAAQTTALIRKEIEEALSDFKPKT